MANNNTASFPYAAPTDAVLSVASDNAATTLTGNSGSIDGVTHTIIVTDTASFSVPALLVIDSEIILAMNKNDGTNTFTNCVRGIGGTTPTTHTDGTDVNGFIVAYHHNQIAAEVKTLGSFLFNSDLSGFKTSENLLSSSELFTGWSTASGVTVSSAGDSLPNGSPATTLLEGTSSGLNAISLVPAGLIDGGTYTFSVYAKYDGTTQWIAIGQRLTGSEENWAWFDIENGLVGNQGAGVKGAAIVPIGNDWYRCMVVVLASTSNAYKAFDIALTQNDTTLVYLGTASNDVLISGAQVQRGDLSGPMSYIKTSGVSFSLTGSGDLVLDEGDLS